jgi:single-strand DNA-binding protein
VTVWGKRGEALSKILAKGSSIFVEGGLRTSSYEKDGEKRYRTEIVANNIILAGRRGEGGARDFDGGPGPSSGGGNGRGGYQNGGSRREAPAPQAAAEDDFGGSFGGDDEIPF